MFTLPLSGAQSLSLGVVALLQHSMKLFHYLRNGYCSSSTHLVFALLLRVFSCRYSTRYFVWSLGTFINFCVFFPCRYSMRYFVWPLGTFINFWVFFLLMICARYSICRGRQSQLLEFFSFVLDGGILWIHLYRCPFLVHFCRVVPAV